MLKIKDLRASVEGSNILNGVDLTIKTGEIHVLMGPNGSGKSTLAQVIAGHPNYKVNSGSLIVNGEDITKLTPDKRAKMGIFLGMQHPVEVPGVSVFAFLRKAKTGLGKGKEASMDVGLGNRAKPKNLTSKPNRHPNLNPNLFRNELKKYMAELKLPEDFLRRALNEGFSGGEKKRNEILQMMALRPKLVILDEIDSGLDVDGLKLVASALKRFAISNPRSAIILITHYARILKYLKVDSVHVMVDGKIVESGKVGLAKQVEEEGYGSFLPHVILGTSKARTPESKKTDSGQARMTIKRA